MNMKIRSNALGHQQAKKNKVILHDIQLRIENKIKDVERTR